MIRRVFLAGWLTVWVFFFSIEEVKAERKVIGPSTPVTAEEKEDVVLRCRVEPEQDVTNETVEWKLQGKLVHRYRSRNDDLDPQDPRFKGRTSLFRKEMVQGNISLKLTNVTQEDAGDYTCKLSKLNAQVTLNVGKVDPGDQKKDLDKDSSTETIAIFVTIFIIICAVAAGGLYFWKCRARKETPGQDRARSETAGLRQEHERTALAEPGSGAEPRSSPLRHRSS